VDTSYGLGARLQAAGFTVAVAESAAGGLIAAALTSQGGSSTFFRGGIVAYDDATKTQLLGIPSAVFEQHGSVSAEAAEAMAQAARRLFGAEYGVGETSIAGPGGATAAKPVGLSYVAVAGPDGAKTEEHRFDGTRAENRQAVVHAALRLVAEVIPME
jgi:PncC family amidohydrolase